MHTVGSRRTDHHSTNPFNTFHKTNLNNNHITSTQNHNHHQHSNHDNNHSHNNSNSSSTNRRRLEHTPSARTISSDDSWCSDRGAFDNDLSSEGEDESDRSVTSTNARNSQLRSTLNKAKHHLSFDKWRGSNSSQSSSSGNVTMPATAQQEATSPGESPAGRLSRWFSIRRGSSHQYDIGGKDTSSRSSSIENEDKPISQNTTPRNSSGNKMPQLSEVFILTII